MTYLTETFIPYTKVLTPLLLEGLWITIYVSALAFLLSIILGAILAIIQHFRVKILSQLAKVYVSYFRGTPLLIQLFLFYYGLPMVFDVMKRCPKTFALVLCLGLNSAAPGRQDCYSIRGSEPGTAGQAGRKENRRKDTIFQRCISARRCTDDHRRRYEYWSY